MSQLVYFRIPEKPGPQCRPLFEIRSVVMARRATARLLVGEVAQFDECEDEIDEATQIPVRYRGRVMAAPLHAIRPVL